MRYGELVLNLMRCIAASAAAEDEQEELNQHTPAMLKKTRPSSKSPSPAPSEALPQPQSAEKFPEFAHAQAVAAAEKRQKEKDDRNDDEMQWPVDAEVFGVAGIAEMAGLLLRMILELSGEIHNCLVCCELQCERKAPVTLCCKLLRAGSCMLFVAFAMHPVTCSRSEAARLTKSLVNCTCHAACGVQQRFLSVW